MKQKCVCSATAYRNNLDGSRDFKTIGNPHCKICRGSGWVKTCARCEGAGVFKSKVCYTCDGNGKVRVEG